MPYHCLEKGQVREEWKGRQDGFIMEYGGEQNLVLYSFLSSPTGGEVVSLMQGGVEIGFSIKRRIGYFTFTFGEGEGQLMGEASYYPGLYKSRGLIATMDEGTPINILVLCIDGDSGQLIDYRLLTLDRRCSRQIAGWCNDVCSGRAGLPVTIAGYNKAVDSIQQTEELEKIHREAQCRWNSKDQKEQEAAEQEAER